jgi:hypothetical protein
MPKEVPFFGQADLDRLIEARRKLQGPPASDLKWVDF